MGLDEQVNLSEEDNSTAGRAREEIAAKEIESIQPEGASLCADHSSDSAIKTLTCSRTGMAPLFTSMQLGSLCLTHRIIMAPLTRLRASLEGVPNVELASRYYSQRATKGGLLISEATNISRQATGRFCAPGIYTAAHVEAWKSITDAVHRKGGFIFLQLWHTGRASHSAYQPDKQLPVGPSPIAIKGETLMPDKTMAPFEVPRELRLEEIPVIVEDYKNATMNAAAAGFDGVEIHGANGYLIDQFLHDGSNHRTDKYGGSIENRCRFALDVISAVKQGWKDAVGATSALAPNVGIRLGPFGTYQSMSDSHEAELYQYLIPKISEIGLAYIHLIEPRVVGNTTRDEAEQETVVYDLGKLFNGPVVTAGGYRPDNANRVIYNGHHSEPQQNIAVAFGRLFISNPDLPLRFFLRAPIHHYDRATFYTHDDVGYTDQPFLDHDAVKTYTAALLLSAPDNVKLQHTIDGEIEILTALTAG